MCAVMITTSLGRSVPRWIATMSQTRVGDGSLSPAKVSQGRTVGRPRLLNWASLQLRAAPMPRLGSVCDESVCRVPKLTRVSIVCRSFTWLTGAMIARSCASGEDVFGGGAAPIKATQLSTASLRIATLPLLAVANWHLADRGSRGARPKTTQSGRVFMLRSIDHFIGGSTFASGERQGEVFDPNQGEVQAHVRFGTAADLQKAVDAAKAAQPAWAATNPQRRARVMFKYRELVEKNMDELAHLLSSEHGKVVADARGDVQRGLEVIEYACGIPQALKGEYTVGAGPGIDVYSMRQPLGIGAGITPFNFPAMIPMWMFGMAIACGNAFIVKPSERDPTVPVRLAELMKEAGLPDGILSVVHGDKEMVDAILDHPDIAAVSFVGSSDIAQYIYSRGTANGKRVQAFGGAKNHGIVMPDADLDQVVNDLAGTAFGSAGERCMALPVVVPVGKETADRLREKLIPAIEGLRVGVSTDPDAHYGPVVSKAHKERIEHYIQMGIDEGAELVVDGRGFLLQGHEEGFFVGPTLFDHVKPSMKTYKEEIFGPVLQMVRANDFEEALKLPSEHDYGNGVAIFTRNGHAAREFTARVNVGMVGINVPIPVPVSYHTFGGWKRSGFGDIDQHGPEGVRFWTKNKKVTQRWPDGSVTGENAFVIPTMG